MSVGETFGGWAFSPEYKENLKGNMPLFTYQEADNVLLLVKGDNGGLKAKKGKSICCPIRIGESSIYSF